jgi:hypothetical protein
MLQARAVRVMRIELKKNKDMIFPGFIISIIIIAMWII